MFLIVFIGVIYLLIGFISLLTALIFIELGRSKDLIQSGLLILQGIFFIIYRNIFTFKVFLILSINALLISFYFIENFSYRWNQLLDKEKFDIKSLSGLKKNFSLIYKIISIDLKNLSFMNIKNVFKNTSIKKKWIRKNDKNNSSNQEESSKQYMTKIQKADFSKKDIISDEKNNISNTKSDKK